MRDSSRKASPTTTSSLSGFDKSVLAGILPNDFGLPGIADLQKLFTTEPSTTESLAKNATETYGLADTPTDFDPSLIAGLSPEVYGLPGEAELLKLFGAFSAPSTSVPASVEPGPSFYFLDAKKNGGYNAPALGSAHPPFDVHAVRRDFPILKERVNGYPLVWFDNAATTQKPQVVIDRVSYFYEHENSNIHRAAHELAARATDAYEKARDTVAHFLNASSSQEIIFVRGTNPFWWKSFTVQTSRPC